MSFTFLGLKNAVVTLFKKITLGPNFLKAQNKPSMTTREEGREVTRN